MMSDEIIIAQTKKWITNVVVGCNFCPFAAREVKRGSIAYEVLNTALPMKVLAAFTEALKRLDASPEIETMFSILPKGFASFGDYLKLLHSAETALTKLGYEGVYQVASFHPKYMFTGSNDIDAANYTNRSPYPMLHLLRESSVSRAVDGYPNTHHIPERNTALANEKGLAAMQALLAACMQVSDK